MNNSFLIKVFLEEWFYPILMELEQFQAGVIPNKQNFFWPYKNSTYNTTTLYPR